MRELTDILGRKEQDLFHSWQTFSDFLGASGVVAFIKAHDGRFIWQNDAYLKAFNLKMEDQLGKNDFECWDHATATQLREHDLEIYRNNEPVMLIEKVPTNGKQDWLVYKFPFQDEEHGQMIGGFAMKIPKSLFIEVKETANNGT